MGFLSGPEFRPDRSLFSAQVFPPPFPTWTSLQCSLCSAWYLLPNDLVIWYSCSSIVTGYIPFSSHCPKGRKFSFLLVDVAPSLSRSSISLPQKRSRLVHILSPSWAVPQPLKILIGSLAITGVLDLDSHRMLSSTFSDTSRRLPVGLVRQPGLKHQTSAGERSCPP